MAKYELTKSDKLEYPGLILYRVKYIKDGSLGGYIESEKNLSQDGDAQVTGNAQVYGDALVSGNARVSGDAQVSGNARVYGNALVYGDAQVTGNAQVYGNALVTKAQEILMVGPIGSRNAMLSAYFDKDKNLLVSTGCYLGTIKEFMEKVEGVYGNKGYGSDYAEAIKFIEKKMKRRE